ncbi:low-density lipoprotein receptor-related protein 11 isoform X1 [Bombina bombina]|uniref:low-density lipoprotein receptor-related protein 11 isoform X1 n=1 Tax=Bombina bombina TaxID=8345 RepID=UPI00235A765B|nr:low-density lipoprotein receptor-related protein 11 isoform X1 [Bombina bombina]
MIYPFPAHHNPVWGVRPLISCLSLFTLLLCCTMGSCRRVSVGSPAPQLTDLRSQISGVEELLEEFRKQLQQQRHQQDIEEKEEQAPHQHPEQATAEQEWANKQGSAEQRDAVQNRPQVATVKEDTIQEQLQGVGVKPAGDVGEDECDFNLMEDYIIRTKDSLEAGAVFLKAPPEVYSRKQCLEMCCSEPDCSAAVAERSGRGMSCYLFDCTYRGSSVCQFSVHRGYSSYTLSKYNSSIARTGGSNLLVGDVENDKPPHSNAGQDVVLQLPIDWVILDGRESTDDYGITQYKWTLLRGDPLVDMENPQPGTLKLSHLQEGVYTLQLTVTDISGQKSSDNVTVSVLPAEHHGTACTGVCSRYQFICDDGCCIDITLACDRVVQCPDGSDEAFCQNFSSGRKTVIHISEKSEDNRDKGILQNSEKNAPVQNSRKRPLLDADKNRSFTNDLSDNNRIMPGTVIHHTTPESNRKLKAVTGTAATSDKDLDNFSFLSKDTQHGSGHPIPEAGAVLPLALGLAITAVLLLMVACRLHLVRQKLKRARPLKSEESDYLINGMYL